ncbi:SDR family oxidoreductase [Novosphingobium profundi]|uniref:SDR family oxidoreductase n=1 Tax=Novosphingobium profundi TaxID=1774954 RepID=UPI001BD95DF7|nr:SDR family oxidoreductase [Novosphingobium profundi]MBT0670257.1 SDR family oxidoreductase [Novosphingobium profundi]
MRVVIVGAGGFIGRHVAGRLRAAGMEVIAAGRSPERLSRLLPGVETIACDLLRDDARKWEARLRGVDALVNCAGILSRGADYAGVHTRGAIALFDGAYAAGVRRVVQISSLGADDTAVTRYHLSKRTADEHLAMLGGDGTRMGWAIVRPSLVLGRGGASMALFSALAALPIVPRIANGNWQVQPIHVDDLSGVVLRLLEAGRPLALKVDAVGPEPMTTDALTTALRQWLGLREAPRVSIPRPLLRLAARLGIGPATPESLVMLERGNTASVEPLVAATGARSLGVEQALALHPAQTTDLMAARLWPIAALLRWLLAVVWLAGGVVSLGFAPAQAIAHWLGKLGLPSALGPLALWSGSLADIAIGLGLIAGVRGAALAGIALMLAYSAILTVIAPELWADPFGPLVKNLAVLGLSLAVNALEVRRD